jgi:hypothetical protein
VAVELGHQVQKLDWQDLEQAWALRVPEGPT